MRASDANGETPRYGAAPVYGSNGMGGGGSININMNNNNHHPPSMGAASKNYYSGAAPGSMGTTYYNNCMQSSQVVEKYSVINTEPVMVRKDGPLIIVDPILETHIKSYLTWSLFNIIFCWIIGGIVTTIMSCNVMRLNDDKQFKAAYRMSGKVLLANMIVTGLGVFLMLVFFPYIYIAVYPYLPKINW